MQMMFHLIQSRDTLQILSSVLELLDLILVGMIY